MKLAPHQKLVIDAARDTLTDPPVSMYELGDMAARIRTLERYLGELLRVVDELTTGETS